MSPAQFYEKIASAIVQHPEMLSVSDRDGDRVVVFADNADYGKLIGRAGRNFQACEDLLQAFAMQRNLPFINLCIRNEKKAATFPDRFHADHVWTKKDDQRVSEFIESIITAIFDMQARCEVKNSSLYKGTHITVSISRFVDDRVKEALSVVVNAAGRNRGRMIQLEIKDRHGKPAKDQVS